jgi:hypothetical protein
MAHSTRSMLMCTILPKINSTKTRFYTLELKTLMLFIHKSMLSFITKSNTYNSYDLLQQSFCIIPELEHNWWTSFVGFYDPLKKEGWKHIRVAKFRWIKIPFQNPFLGYLKIRLKYEYLDYIESNIFFHFQFQIMML